VAAERPWTVVAGGLVVVVRLTPKGGRDAIDRIEQLADGKCVLKARVRAAASELLKHLPAEGALAEYIYVIDPLGNVVLRYARDAEPGRMIKDLTRLLKTSGIG